MHDSYIVPATGLSGGLWLLWNDEVDLQVVHSSRFYILAKCVHKPTSQNFNLVCIYGDPHHQQTSLIWQDVSTFVLAIPDTPTFCMGDMNNIMHVAEKCGPKAPNFNRIRDFCYLVKQCGLFDLGYNGPAYTWSNKRFTTNPTYERLDRCLANAEWCTIFPRTTIYHLPILYSDHAPILAILESKPTPKPKPFRFENWWLLEEDFQTTANASWSKTANNSFHTRTNQLAKDLKHWSKAKKPIHQQLDQIEKQLIDLQLAHPSNRNHSKEATLTHQHHHLMQRNAEYHRQRVKKTWVCKGDRNTNFFHQAIIKRTRKNRISLIQDSQGVDSQIWHLLRPTGLTGRVCTVRVELGFL